jgi:hypothetical protein
VDRVIKDYREVALDIPRGDGEKTLGQAELSFIVWCKRYIIIPGAPARVPSPPSELVRMKVNETFFNHSQLLASRVNNHLLSIIFLLTGLPT